MTSELTKRIAIELRRRLADLQGESETKVSRRSVAVAAGLSQTIGNDIFRGVRAPTTDELEALCEQLETDFIALVLRAAGPERVAGSVVRHGQSSAGDQTGRVVNPSDVYRTELEQTVNEAHRPNELLPERPVQDKQPPRKSTGGTAPKRRRRD